MYRAASNMGLTGNTCSHTRKQKSSAHINISARVNYLTKQNQKYARASHIISGIKETGCKKASMPRQESPKQGRPTRGTHGTQPTHVFMRTGIARVWRARKTDNQSPPTRVGVKPPWCRACPNRRQSGGRHACASTQASASTQLRVYATAGLIRAQPRHSAAHKPWQPPIPASSSLKIVPNTISSVSL